MTTVAIDTLAAVRKLEKAGFKTEQAEAVAEVMANQSSELATKADIAGVRGEIAGVRGKLLESGGKLPGCAGCSDYTLQLR